MTKIIVYSTLFLAILIIAVELILRISFGLGNPPLIKTHDKIEYLNLPDSSYVRFGNIISYNEHGMRRAPIPIEPASDATCRIFVLGDSIVHGGATVDQSDIFTSRLADQLGSTYYIGNISAGSWGPSNIRSFLEEFGNFDADLFILVTSTHDLTDLPDFRQCYGDNQPIASPTSATSELLIRYILPRLIKSWTVDLNKKCPASILHSENDRVKAGEAAYRELLAYVTQNSAETLIIAHPEISELPAMTANRARLFDITSQYPVKLVDGTQDIKLSLDDYRDKIHLNKNGHDEYFNFIYSIIDGCSFALN